MTSITVHENAVLTAHRLDPMTGKVVGALYDASGHLIPESVRSIERADRWHMADPERVRRRNAVGKYEPQPRAESTGVDVYLERAVFAGHLFGAWGHLITETLSTAWAAEQLPHAPVLLVPWGRVSIVDMARRFEVLRLAGWDDREILVTSGDCIFGTVHVPERLVRLDEVMHEDAKINSAMSAVYDRLVARCAPLDASIGPVFFARSEGHRRAHDAELEVAQRLSAEGVRIVCGWKLAVAEQIATANAASAIIGFSGSNLHNSLFARPGTCVVEIQDERAQARTDHGPRNLQDALCVLRDQPHVRVTGFANGLPRDAQAIVREINAALRDKQRRG